MCSKSGHKITNLQLQKLLYMADMNFVGQGKGRLVDEDFEAWDYGPVLPSLYHKCKAFGSKPVPKVFWDAEDISGSDEALMLDLAWEKLKSATPGQLVKTTHSSLGAWVRRYVAGARQIKIMTDDMIEEYARRTSRT
nr:type II toxin-antitoxin system antitoxin SocA domain-containing protein [Sulfitobacter geojensis]